MRSPVVIVSVWSGDAALCLCTGHRRRDCGTLRTTDGETPCAARPPIPRDVKGRGFGVCTTRRAERYASQIVKFATALVPTRSRPLAMRIRWQKHHRFQLAFPLEPPPNPRRFGRNRSLHFHSAGSLACDAAVRIESLQRHRSGSHANAQIRGGFHQHLASFGKDFPLHLRLSMVR